MSEQRANGIGFVGFLTLLFIALKLGHIIDWSWFWVLSPLIISTALGFIFMVLVFMVVGIFFVVGVIAAARS